MPYKHTFLKPFQGKPSPLKLSGLFLFSPEVDMKLLGFPVQKMFAEQGKESLFKRMHNMRDRDIDPNSEAARNVLEEMLHLMHGSEFESVFKAAIDGDAAAQAQLNSLGEWELSLYGKWAGPNVKLTPQNHFFLEIERACKEPLKLINQGQSTAAAIQLSTCPVMSHFFCPKGLEIISSAKQLSDLTLLRVSVALEIRLSYIALVDVTLAQQLGTPDITLFSCLIPADSESGNPTRLFFRWLMRKAGVKTIRALHEKISFQNGDEVDISTLKRWSSGSQQPNEPWMNAVALTLFGDAPHSPLWERYGASRYLNFIGHTAATIRDRVVQATQARPEIAMSFTPWPHLPYGYDTVPSWLSGRFPHWLAFHQSRLSTRADL